MQVRLVMLVRLVTEAMLGRWVMEVSEEETGEAALQTPADSWPALHSPNSPQSLRALELQEVLSVSLPRWSDLLPW